MLIHNNSQTNMPSPMTTLPNQETSASFGEEISQTKGRYFHEDTIFTTINGAPIDYTVHQTGTFPDSSFFAEMFQKFDGNFDDVVIGAIKPDGTVFGYGTNDYFVYYEYAAESTPENPVMNVRLEFPDQKEAWEGTVNLNEIHPSNASHMEMSLLSAHLTGEPLPVPGLNLGADDPFSRVNFLDLFEEALEYAKKQGEIYRDSAMLEFLEEHFQYFETYMEKRLKEEESSQKEDQIHLKTQLEQEQLTRELLATLVGGDL